MQRHAAVTLPFPHRVFAFVLPFIEIHTIPAVGVCQPIGFTPSLMLPAVFGVTAPARKMETVTVDHVFRIDDLVPHTNTPHDDNIIHI